MPVNKVEQARRELVQWEEREMDMARRVLWLGITKVVKGGSRLEKDSLRTGESLRCIRVLQEGGEIDKLMREYLEVGYGGLLEEQKREYRLRLREVFNKRVLDPDFDSSRVAEVWRQVFECVNGEEVVVGERYQEQLVIPEVFVDEASLLVVQGGLEICQRVLERLGVGSDKSVV